MSHKEGDKETKDSSRVVSDLWIFLKPGKDRFRADAKINRGMLEIFRG
jgi:hypothetical protein